MKQRLEHGGDPSVWEGQTGSSHTDWLDLSTGINPFPYPIPNLPEQAWTRLPTRSDEDRLIDAARRYYAAAANAALVAAPGTQAIIQWLPRLRPTGTVDIISPTYGEHAARWQASGHSIRELSSVDETDADVVVLVNPNNPTGAAIEPKKILEIADKQSKREGWMIVDEAFADVDPDISVASETGRNGLIVLRSFGKFFGLAGVRLGFAIGQGGLIHQLSDAMGPWAVPGPALWVGERAFLDQEWQSTMRQQLSVDSTRMDALLSRASIRVLGGTSLFRLGHSDQAEEIALSLARDGIHVRTFEHEPTWLRFGLPGVEENWRRLEKCLDL